MEKEIRDARLLLIRRKSQCDPREYRALTRQIRSGDIEGFYKRFSEILSMSYEELAKSQKEKKTS